MRSKPQPAHRLSVCHGSGGAFLQLAYQHCRLDNEDVESLADEALLLELGHRVVFRGPCCRVCASAPATVDLLGHGHSLAQQDEFAGRAITRA